MKTKRWAKLVALVVLPVVLLWVVAARRSWQPRTWPAHKGDIYSLGFSPDGRLLASAGSEAGSHAAIRVWRVESRRLQLEFSPNCWGTIIFTPDSKGLWFTDDRGFLNLRDVASGKHLWRNSDWRPQAFIVSPDGKNYAHYWVGGFDSFQSKKVELWRISGARAGVMWPEATASTAVFSPNSNALAVSGYHFLTLWDVRSCQLLRRFPVDQGWISNTTFAPNGRMLVITHEDSDHDKGKALYLWDVATGNPVRSVQGFAAAVMAIAFTPDGGSLVSGEADGTITLWDTQTWTPRRTMRNPMASIGALAVSPDGATLAVGAGKSITLWRIK